METLNNQFYLTGIYLPLPVKWLKRTRRKNKLILIYALVFDKVYILFQSKPG